MATTIKTALNLNSHTSESSRRRRWHPTPVLLPGKSHGRRNLVGCSPSGRRESDTTEQVQFHFSLSYIGEGNGNSLQCTCLENPRDGGAWWTAVYGVAQSQTQLKRLSSSSSSSSSKMLLEGEEWCIVLILAGFCKENSHCPFSPTVTCLIPAPP